MRLQDRPDALERLASTVARQNANIVETFHNHQHFGASLGESAIDMTLETRSGEHARN
jgi:hypothetical protein